MSLVDKKGRAVYVMMVIIMIAVLLTIQFSWFIGINVINLCRGNALESWDAVGESVLTLLDFE